MGHTGMTKQEFSKRRKRLMDLMDDNAVAILPAAPMRMRNRDVEYHYRQDSDFYYLTGFAEHDAVAVIIPGRKQAEYILFCRERNPDMEIWTGAMAGQEGAVKDYGADDSFPIDDIDDILPGLLENKQRVYYTMGAHPDFDQRLIGWVNRLRKQSRAGIHTPGEFVSLDHLLHDMRLIKSAAEIKAMRHAAAISAKAHCQAMKMCRPGLYEYQVEATLLQHFMDQGARDPAYGSIVGGGANGCVLHYTTNHNKLKEGDLLLIDAGAEYDYYAADITRTFPINGEYSKAQRKVYDVVLAAQYAAIDKVKPGNHWNEPHEAAVEVITDGLLELGLLKGSKKNALAKETYKKFYMHRTGHWLGMDVHDVGDYKVEDEWRVFEPGMVLTVEPGIYISSMLKGVAEKWKDIGIRIEDDVLVTKQGHEVLTDGVPKEADEIEALMA